MLLAALHGQGIIMGGELSMPWNYREQTVFDLLRLITKLKFRPHIVLVKREELFHILQNIASALEINLNKVKRIPAVEAARTEMANFMP